MQIDSGKIINVMMESSFTLYDQQTTFIIRDHIGENIWREGGCSIF